MKKWIIVGTGFITLLMAVGSMLVIPASADADWLGSQLSIQSDDGNICSETQEEIIDWPSGNVMIRDACVVYGEDFDVAYTEDAQNNSLGSVYMRMHGSTEFIILTNTARLYLVPGSNAVVYEDGSGESLVYVKDFTKVIDKHYSPIYGEASQGTPYFDFNKSVFDDRFLTTSITEYDNSILSYKVSNNGRYVVAYFDHTGIAKYDLINHQTTLLLTASAFNAWEDYDQPKVAAISNDGRFVLMSPDAWLVDTENCGDLKAEHFNIGMKILRPCKMRDLTKTVKNTFGQNARVDAARFSEDGNMLKLFIIDERFGTVKHRMILSTSNIKIIKYLALGDSYSSGEGDVSYVSGRNNYLSGTEGQFKCHVSYRSYPFLLQEQWNIASNEMKSVACSGAKVSSDYYGAGDYQGQINNLKGKTDSEKEALRRAAINNFTPGVVRQIDFVAKYKPDTVTFTGGGNDVGFGEILAYCASPHLKRESCPQASDPQISANLRRAIDDERAPLTEFINKMKDVSPETKIYLIGYPQFIALKWCLNDSELLNLEERDMVRSSVARLNNILKLVARDTDVYYVDVEDSLEGGQICQGSEYMTGPLKIIGKVVTGQQQEAYHPNAEGNEKLADAIDNRIKNGDLSYTIIDIPPERDGQRVIKKAVTKDYVGVGSEQTVTMDPGIFHEDGTVDSEMFSTRVSLGRAKTARDGSLHMKITIPKNIEPGEHLLTFTGEGINGDTVQVQQYITVGESQIDLVPPVSDASSLVSVNKPVQITPEASPTEAPSLSIIDSRQNSHPSARMDSFGYGSIKDDSSAGMFEMWEMIPLIVGMILIGALYVTKKER